MDWMDVEISVDLINAARRHLHFLDNVDNVEKILNDKTLLELSIRRYEQLWFPLVDENRSTQIVAPIDIAWMWYCHMLCPLAYRRDCRLILRRTLNHSFIRSRDVIESTNNAIELWYGKYPKDGFNIIRNGEFIVPTRKIGKLSDNVSRLSIDLITVAKSQIHFCYQVALPHFRDKQYLETALKRYKQFLCMKREAVDQFLTPPVDILIMWFTHMCHPLEYATDTMKACGRVLENNIRIQVGSVTDKFRFATQETVKQWTSFSKESLVQPGTKFRARDTKTEISEMNTRDLKSCCVVEYKLNITHAELIGVSTKGRRFRVRMHLMHSDSSKDEIIILKASKRQRHWTFKSTVLYVTNIHCGLRVALTEDNNIMCLKGENTIAAGTVKLTPILEDMREQEKTLLMNIEMGEQLFDDNIKLRVQLDGKVEEARPLTCNLTLLESKEGFKDCILGAEELQRTFGRSALADNRKSHRCFFQTVKIRNHENEGCFNCRVIHIPEQLLSGVQVFFHDKLMATSYVIGSSQLPTPAQVARSDLSMAFDPEIGERAMLIRNGKGDWGLCIGRWAKVADEEFLKIRFMRLSKIKLKMLEVHTVDLHFQSFYASLQTGTMTIDPSSNSIPENIALIFTISILHVLCSPENANRQIKSTLVMPTDNAHTETHSVALEAKVPESNCALLLAAGLKTSVPSNTYMLKQYGSLSVDLAFDAQDIYIDEVKVDRSIFKKDSKLSKYDVETDSPRRIKTKKHSKSKLKVKNIDADQDSTSIATEVVKETHTASSAKIRKEVKPKKIKKRRSTKLDDTLCPSDDSLDLDIKEEMQFLQKKGTEAPSVIETVATEKLLMKKKKSSNLDEELSPSEDSLDEAEKEWKEFKKEDIESDLISTTESGLVLEVINEKQETGDPEREKDKENNKNTVENGPASPISDKALNQNKTIQSLELNYTAEVQQMANEMTEADNKSDMKQKSTKKESKRMRQKRVSKAHNDLYPDESPESGSLTPVEVDIPHRRKRKRQKSFDKGDNTMTVKTSTGANNNETVGDDEKKADFYI